MGVWIDFKKLREQLDFADLLRSYGVELKANGAGQHRGRCPLPGHPHESKSLCFNASLKKKIFRCHGCGRSGNLLDFAIFMARRNPKVPADVRHVAVELQAKFLSGGSAAPKERKSMRAGESLTSKSKELASVTSRVLVNAPLDFALKNLDSEHPDLLRRGLLRPTIEHFGLGFCSKGVFSGRIAVPFCDGSGMLVGYGGLATEMLKGAPDAPRYLWPGPREHKGTRHEFDQSKLLYHAHEVERDATDLYVVQWPESAWWLWQCGYRDVVALAGSEPAGDQLASIVRLVRPTGRIWILTDRDEGGQQCAQELLLTLSIDRFCKWVRIAEEKPEHLPSSQLGLLLAWKV